MAVITQTLTLSVPVFVAPKGVAPRKRKFSTLSDLSPEEFKFAAPTGPAPKKRASVAPAPVSPKPFAVPVGPAPGKRAPGSPRPLPRTPRHAQIPVAPQNPAPQLVKSPQFFTDIRGKLRSLARIRAHPNASTVANRQAITKLLSFLYSFVGGPNLVVTPQRLETHQMLVKEMNKLEEIVIRGVIKGEKL